MRRCLLVVTLAVAAFACGDNNKSSGGEALKAVGQGEKALNLIVWAGYAEDGSTLPDYDWVHPFQDQTGCVVKSKIAATSDEIDVLILEIAGREVEDRDVRYPTNFQGSMGF